MILVVHGDTIKSLYTSQFPLLRLGKIHSPPPRLSDVEPDDQGQWWVRFRVEPPVVLGPFPFDQRDQALEAEREYAEKHLLNRVKI